MKSESQTGRSIPAVVLRPKGPFDLALSLRAAASFLPAAGPPPTILRTPIQLDDKTAIIEVSQPTMSASGHLHASSTPRLRNDRLGAVVKWLVSADLDLRPFYTAAARDPLMRAVVRALHGLKPLRPATLFEMAIVAITEQQLSLAAAFHIRSRLVKRFGTPLDGLWVFPTPERLAHARLRDLGACGLSHRKAEYVRALARRIAEGDLALDALKRESDQRITQDLLRNRGFGEWSVQYILARGFGRTDSLPSGDVGLRRVVGYYVASGRRLTATELEDALARFKPFRALAAFYFAVHWRLCRASSAAHEDHP